jgi:hypothetical protein
MDCQREEEITVTQIDPPAVRPELTRQGAADVLEDAAVYLRRAYMALGRLREDKGDQHLTKTEILKVSGIRVDIDIAESGLRAVLDRVAQL